MTENKITRRQALCRIGGMLAAPVALTGIGGLVPSLLFAAVPTTVLTDPEIQTVQAMADSIIPVDVDPGAIDINIGQLIAASISNQKPADIEKFRYGVAAVNNLSLSFFQRPLYGLVKQERDYLLNFVSTHPELSPFWHVVRSLTIVHFYSHPVGYTQIGLPGPNIELGLFRNADSLGCMVA